MAKVIEKDIESLVPDDRNFNRGTEYGEHLIDKSLQSFGLGRSILIDRNDRIIAGNKTHQKAVENGFKKVVVVETDGKTLVAVKRKDIDLDSKRGRELALADNATSEANLSWDSQVILEQSEKYEFDPSDWGVDLEPNDDEKPEKPEQTDVRLVVSHPDASKLSLLYRELSERGFVCDLKE